MNERIFYFTTSLQDEDYSALLKMGYALANPSNQNFHNKLIQSLALTHPLEVISLVPTSLGDTTLLDANHYHYIAYPSNALLALFSRKKEAVRRADSLYEGEEALVVFDALSVKAAAAALSFASKHHLRSLAVLTDNPNNLAKAPSFYRNSVFSLAKKAQGYLALSSGLLSAYGVAASPHFVFEGIVEESELMPCSFKQGSFLYFGGSLLSRYGIDNLITAFRKKKPDYDLLIAGHSPDPERFLERIKEEPRIKFLGQVDKTTNYTLERNAALLINPRPYEERLDRESVPSKLLEYLASGRPILSTMHSALYTLFPDDVNWLDGVHPCEIEEFFIAHLDPEKHFVNLKENKAQTRIEERYSLQAINHGFDATFTSAQKSS